MYLFKREKKNVLDIPRTLSWQNQVMHPLLKQPIGFD